MKNETLIESTELLFNDCIEVMQRKNHDYAGEGNDEFKNFRVSEVVGVPIERGILTRIMDKISRISTLIDNDAKVEDERIEDTILDAINYLAILNKYLETKKQ